MWLSCVNYPIKTVQITDNIFDSLEKVGDGQNPVYEAEFINPDILDEWNAMHGNDARWQKEAFETMRERINSVVVIDIPQEQTTETPEPYEYILDIGKVIDYDTDDKTFEWIIFHLSDTSFAVIDEVTYRVFTYDKQKGIHYAVMTQEASHDIGYCPVHWFWDDEINNSDPDIKMSPLTSHLEELDWLLFFLIAKNVADIHGAFPITWAYSVDCSFKSENLERGIFMECDHGLLKDNNRQWLYDADGKILRCPACSGSKIIGPGTHIGVPMPDPSQDDKPLGVPAGHIERDILSLDFIVKEIERRSKNLYQDITGYGGEPNNDQAQNEKQIISAFEMRTGILRNLKRNFEKIKIWIDSTKARIKYGDKFIRVTYDMGTEFYLHDANTLLTVYQDGIAKELPKPMLDSLQDQYHYTKYRNNSTAIQRYELEKHIIPFRHIPESKAVTLWQKGIISDEDLQIILNFPTFVSRFEREQSSLLYFGINLPLDKRVEAIKKIIYSYVRTITKPIQPVSAGA